MAMKDIPGAKGIPTDNSIQVGKAMMPDNENQTAIVPAPPRAVARKEVVQMTFSELLGTLTQRVLYVTGSDSTPAAKREAIEAAYRDLQLWHDALPVENRVALVKEYRVTLERFKQLGEALLSRWQLMTMNEVQ